MRTRMVVAVFATSVLFGWVGNAAATLCGPDRIQYRATMTLVEVTHDGEPVSTEAYRLSAGEHTIHSDAMRFTESDREKFINIWFN